MKSEEILSFRIDSNSFNLFSPKRLKTEDLLATEGSTILVSPNLNGSPHSSDMSASPSVSEIIEADIESENRSYSLLASTSKRLSSIGLPSMSGSPPVLNIKTTQPLSPELLSSFYHHFSSEIPIPVSSSTPQKSVNCSMNVNVATPESHGNSGFVEHSDTKVVIQGNYH